MARALRGRTPRAPQLHPGLDAALVDVIVDKGTDPATEGYSGFDGTDLAALLRERGIDRVTVAGLATDYCVAPRRSTRCGPDSPSRSTMAPPVGSTRTAAPRRSTRCARPAATVGSAET